MLMQYLYIGGYRMSEFSDIMTRVKLDNIIGYLIYGIEDYEMKKRRARRKYHNWEIEIAKGNTNAFYKINLEI